MNPPFSHNRDIAHIMHAWRFVAAGGTLVAVASSGVKFRQDRMTAAFREFVVSNKGIVIDMDDDSFKDSGTSVSTVVIVIEKEK